jgi:hypothetical protein
MSWCSGKPFGQRPELLHGKTPGGLCRHFVGHVAICVSGFALRPPIFPFPQDGADAMDVPGDDSERHVAFESVNPMIRTGIKTMDLQCVDRRLNRRVLTSRLDEILRATVSGLIF